MEVRNITKAATFKSLLHLSYKIHTITLFTTVLFNIFIKQTLTNDFWGLHKNMNHAFPLKSPNNFEISFRNSVYNGTESIS